MSEKDDVQIHQGLRIFGVEVGRQGDQGLVRVDLYGGDESICGTVLYKVNLDELAGLTNLFRGWQAEGTSLTYKESGNQSAIIDPLRQFEEMYGKSA